MAAEPARDALIGRRILVNTLSNYVGKILTLGIGFILTPFILRELGAGDFGLWALIGAFIGYGSLLDLGIAGAVIKYVAEYRAKADMERAHKLVSTSLSLYSVLGLFAIVASVLIAPIFPSLFNIPAEKKSEAAWLFLLMGITLGISLPASTASAVLRGFQRFDLVNVLNVTASLISTACIVVVLLAGGGLVGLVAVGIPITLVMQVPSIWLIRRVAPALRFGWRGADWRESRAIFSFSSALFVMNLAGQLESETDEMVIGAFMPLRFITPYALARRLSEIGQVLTDQFMRLLLPLASELNAGNEQERLRLLYITSTRLTLAIYLPIACVLFIFSRQILTAWVGSEFAANADLVVVLTLSSLIATSQWPAGSILQGMARHRLLAMMALGSGLANLGLSVFFVQRFGLLGVAIGTLIPMSIECLLIVMPYTLHVLKLSFRQAVRETWLATLIPSLPTLLALYLISEFLQPSSLWSLAAVAIVAVAVYATSYLVIGANPKERQMYRNLLLMSLHGIRSRMPSYSARSED